MSPSVAAEGAAGIENLLFHPPDFVVLMRRHSWFNRFAKWTARAAGHPATFSAAIAVIVIWAATGPLFAFNDTWQLVINTGTTIVTFLMVFLIQNSQNRDGAAVQIKLDELIRAIEGAHNALLDLEELEEADLERLRKRYIAVAAKARQHLRGETEEENRSECEEPMKALPPDAAKAARVARAAMCDEK